MFNRFWKYLAGKLPRQLVFWAAVRIMADKMQPDGTIEVRDDWAANKLRRWQEYARERRIWWHSQNLTDGKYPVWRQGRGWLHLWEKLISLEWHLFSRYNNFSVTIRIGSEESHQLQFHLELPYLCSIFLSFERFFHFREWKYWGVFGRQTGIRFFDQNLWLEFWHNDAETRSAKWPKKIGIHIYYEKHGFMISFDWKDFFLGYAKYTECELQTTYGNVKLPEGDYPVKVIIFESTWKRPRWHWPRRIVHAEIKAEYGIPSHAGKGENSWDLDDDALFSMTCPENTPEAALKRVAESIMRDRERYGSPSDLLEKQAAKISTA